MYTHSRKEPIAIIGTGCRLPGNATNPSKLWELLYSPRDLSKPIPPEARFNAEGYYHQDGERHGCSNVKNAYVLEEDPRLFDAGFFGISPREAEAMDPQQRLLLETVYEAMENAGLSLEGLRGSDTSAYVGAMTADYTDTQVRDHDNQSQYMITGTSRAILSNRLSYVFDWRGPSIAVDTACSSSLAAVHMGVQSLRNGECTLSCVAGSNVILGPDVFLMATSLHLLSPTGKSQMWDQAADGYARGEGVCVFFLKTLSQALRDGDRIDALIRESAINSDGRTKGIALPSAQAQAALIRRTYENSGLDMLQVEDRPQYIEAHGTGTQAGDPIEASALSQSFFPPGHEVNNHPPIFVGSIKTIIGHTEGSAGIAGILKALLAMQHRIIPPNQHFHNLNPNIKPYYGNLQIATRPRQWPPVPSGQPLRASINGFGSGGTNCHVILETYVPEVHHHGPWGKAVAKRNVPAPALPDTEFTPIPLVFSAISGPALSVMVKRYADHLQQNDVPLQSLAMTLHSHRSLFPARIAFTGTSKMAITQAMNKELTKLSQSPGAEIGTRVPTLEFDENRRPRIMGIFTGQGAQWAGMGQDLIKRNTLFRKTIEDMETSLAALPDPPAWSLKDELMAPPAESRLSEAEISLPLCTAIQVGLTRLLSAAGITFHTVVGHSGGEVAAAYAAGKISASAAVAISYYRGVHVKRASRPDEKAGAMIAVGFGYDEGIKFCSSHSMEGRLCVGASNSPKSVTLSGDEDAVLEAKAIFDKDGLFNRVLKVDKAYHSPHVYPAGQPYIDALESCNIAAGQGNGTTHWVSSVYDDTRTMDSTEDEELRANYWKENLVRTVLFSQAVERAVDDGRGSLDLILEVGPHPALKGPTLETTRSKLGSEVPYSGVLDRKAEDVTAFSKALGFVWTHVGPACVDFGGFLSSFDDSEGKLNTIPLPNLPSYPWDHKKILWKESRYNKQIRLRTEGPHELLGSRTGDDTDFEPRWRNYLKLDEIPWLRDHIIQSQIITPAATYCVLALEAAKVLCKGKSVKSIELCNIDIMRPIILDEASEGAEILLSLRSDLDSNSKSRVDLIHADFSLSSGMIEDHHLRTCATGEIRIVLAGDEPATVDFSATRPTAPRAELLPVNVSQFYESLEAIGLDYRNSFRALKKLERRLDMASAVVSIDETAKSLVVHPTWLDACFQTFFAAFASPQDGSLSTPFMPTTVGRMVFSPTLSSNKQDRPGSFTIDTQITSITPGYQTTLPKLTGDINVYDCETGKLEVRIEDFTMSSFLPAAEKDDRSLYLSIVMKQDILSGALFDVMEPMIAPRGRRVIDACERVVDHYLSVLGADERLEDVAGTSSALKCLVRQAAYRGSRAATPAELSSIFEEFGDHPDMVLVKTIGDKILGHSKSSAPKDGASLADMITRWHNMGLGFTEIHSHIVGVARQIAHKHAHLKILQVGPSSAKLVRDVYHALGNAVSSYVIADESPEALNTMREELLPDGVEVDIKQFDFEHQTQEIGSVFGETPFDLVIAHKAFIKQPAALRTVRSLMRPGAFLLMMAATGRQLRFPFFLLSGPPPVMADDETAQPQIGNPTREEVHNLLQRCGFSGVDSMALDNVWEKHTFSLAVSQAVDDHIRFMRAPLSLPPPSAATRGKLLLLGGSSSKIATVIQAIRTTLGTTWRGEVIGIESLDILTPDHVNGVEIAVSLADLDGPVLDGISPSAFKRLQLFLKGPKVVLWVTKGARSDSPYQNATIGLMRSFQSENPQRVVQLLDVDATESAATIVAESLLRLDAGVMRGEGETGESRLWVVEPELVVQHGKYLIPRVMPDRERNDRLNALRRKVEIQTSLETQPVTLLRSLRDSGEVVYAAHEAPEGRSRLAGLRSGEDQITLKVEYCSAYPVLPNRNSPLFACIGRTAQGVRYLALSSTNSSVITIPPSYVIKMEDDSFRDSAAIPVLSHVLHEIQARLIDHNLPPGWLVLLYDADPQLVTAIGEGSIRLFHDVKLVGHHSLPIGHIEVKPAISRKELASMIPTNTRLLIDMARHSSARQLAAVRQALPRSVPVVSFSDLSSDGLVPQEVLARALVSTTTHCSSSGLALGSDCVLPASVAIDTKNPSRTSATIIDWTGNQTITLHRVPVDPHHLFSPAKTYLLFGLSGQIGQSMCRWMFANGVRHLVVTSRNPDKNAAWKTELEEQGAQVLLESADVAKKQDLVDLRNRVVAIMPPIGGVANGAMVLADQNFADMSYEAFADSQRPKVEGSKNLEEVFCRDALDFFLMFSSISAVTGQRFQANYAAANNFMVGLAAQMRARNVPAAVIDIGMVIGIGVVSAATAADGSNAMMAALRKVDYMPVSERDLHHLLAEGILAARSSGPFEITTGLEVYSTTGNQPFWHKNPLFSHLIANTKSSRVGKVSGDSAQKPLREKLEGAVGPDDRVRTMEEAFMAYLESSLKLPSKSIYTDLPLIDLGIDSLVAVEIRNWVSAETGHDIPVLKILGGSSIKQICTDVAASFRGSKPDAPETQPQPHVTPPPTTEVKPSEAVGPEVDSSLSPPLRPIPRPSSAEDSLASRSSDTDATSDTSLNKPPLPATYRTAPLSRGQSRLYFLAQYLEDATVLNCTISYRLSGPLDAVKLTKSLEAASNRHETLRTIFYTDEVSGQPVQGVMDRSRFRLKTSPGFDDPTGEKEFDKLHQYHYDLEQGDTFHATLLSHGADSHTIIFAYHHIVMDGVSWQVFLKDLSAFYNDPSSVSSPPPLPTQYVDFTLKQQRDLSAGAYDERLEFFKDLFSRPVDPLPVFPFAKVSTRKSATSYRVRDIVRHIDTGLLSAMKKRSRESRTTSSHFFLAALQIMLHRLLDIEEMCIGMVDANRSDQSFDNTIGFFLETLPILFQVDGRQKFSDVLQATRTKAYKALSQTGVPMEEILRACNISASATETPLFQVVFNYRMGAGRTSSLEGLDMEYLAYADAKHTFDLVVSVDELPNGTAMITLSVQDYLYDQEGADLLIDTYIHLLREISRDTSQTVGSIPVFNSDLAKHAVALGTGVVLEPPPRSVGTLSKMIHAWVQSDPEGLAVKDGQGRTRTYRGLSQRAAAISATLLEEGIRPGSPVSVFLDPEVDTIATILGILQIGATYVPLDIRNTDEAVADIQQECGATLMIYHSATGQRARVIQNLLTSPEQVRMISLDTIAPEAVPEIEDMSTPEGVAMILYTSGSTGKPKGIPLTHGNLRTTIIGVTERVGLGREVMLQQCCQGFDSAIFQIFNCLANGGTLIIADNRCDPAELAQLMAREGVTCGLFIVSEMQSMLKYGYEALGRCSSWRIAMVAGEAFTANLLDQFRSLKRPDLKIINTYGPTEAAICSSQYEILPDDSVITIGKPLANYGVYIVDEECRPVPVGWPGELVISGPGIASGYIDLPELTRAKFRNHVFEGAPPGWGRAYLTGDRGRMMSDGSILVSGRMNGDGEVKIRGMRVQLDDVARELVYASKGNLVDAAILVRGGGAAENQNLIAFVVFASTSEVESKEVYLRRLIQELPIPRYMRPTIAVPLDTLPVTGRGKLDRRRLAAVPLPQLSGTGTDDEQFTEAEIRLRRVWRAALGDISSSVQIRRSSDFFSVGGNSLLLIPLRLEIRKVFAVDISIPELFQTSTLELMAARLSGKSQEVNIDWQEETQVDDAFLAALPRTMIDTPPMSGLSVLLTGATGFLGTALLRELVRLPNVTHIHCVAVRADSQNGHRRLGVESPKITQFPGDLALPHLGMEEADLTALFEKVHVVIHNGAEVSHMKNYRSLRDSNFISTITLARLAAQRQIPVHYVSTGGVARLSGAVVQPESSLAAFKPPADGSDGYVASKWASEVFLEKVHRHSHGQGIWIHRPSSITGDDVPALDIVHNILRFSKLLRAVPSLNGSTGAFDFIHVDSVAKDIAWHVLTSRGEKGATPAAPLRYVHHSGEEVVAVDQLRNYIAASVAGPVKTLSLKDWVASAVEQGLDEVVASFLLASNGLIRVPVLQRTRR